MIKLMNEKGDDLSADMMLNVGVMLAFVQGGERICNVLNRLAASQGYTVRLLRENKKAFNELQSTMKRLQYLLDNYFSGSFDLVESTVEKCEAMHDLSLIMVRMGLVYLSKIEKDNKNITRCLERVMAYKGSPELHIDEILEMYIKK